MNDLAHVVVHVQHGNLHAVAIVLSGKFHAPFAVALWEDNHGKVEQPRTVSRRGYAGDARIT